MLGSADKIKMNTALAINILGQFTILGRDKVGIIAKFYLSINVAGCHTDGPIHCPTDRVKVSPF